MSNKSFQIAKSLKIRMLETKDSKELFDVVTENRSHLREWLPWLDYNTKSKDSEAFIEITQKQYLKDKSFQCGVFYNNSLVGMCGFHPINYGNNSVTIGYWLAKGHEGKGIITKCSEFFINYAFQELKLNKVCIPVAEKNIKSRAVAERLGLINEGLEREAEVLYGKYVNHIRYSILRSEFKKNLISQFI